MCDTRSFGFELCKCQCHSATGITMRHIAPCCGTCGYCGQNITFLSYEGHVDSCKKKHTLPKKLLSFTAPSGAGKTTLAGELIKQMPGVEMVVSYTTRTPRPNDLPGEYKYVSETEYWSMCERDMFLWAAVHGTTNYGTKADDIKGAFKSSDGFGIMILVPTVIPKLLNFLRAHKLSNYYVPIFVVPPEREILEKRLRDRGDGEEEIQKRLDEAASWVRDARASTIPYAYVSNNGDIAEATKELLSLLSTS